jgi:hypothetical protein
MKSNDCKNTVHSTHAPPRALQKLLRVLLGNFKKKQTEAFAQSESQMVVDSYDCAQVSSLEVKMTGIIRSA